MRWANVIVAAALLLAGCNQKVAPDATVPDASAVSGPKQAGAQIAYLYSFGFTLPAGQLKNVQARHVADCDRLGAMPDLVDATDRRRRERAGGSGTGR